MLALLLRKVPSKASLTLRNSSKPCLQFKKSLSENSIRARLLQQNSDLQERQKLRGTRILSDSSTVVCPDKIVNRPSRRFSNYVADQNVPDHEADSCRHYVNWHADRKPSSKRLKRSSSETVHSLKSDFPTCFGRSNVITKNGKETKIKDHQNYSQDLDIDYFQPRLITSLLSLNNSVRYYTQDVICRQYGNRSAKDSEQWEGYTKTQERQPADCSGNENYAREQKSSDCSDKVANYPQQHESLQYNHNETSKSCNQAEHSAGQRHRPTGPDYEDSTSYSKHQRGIPQQRQHSQSKDHDYESVQYAKQQEFENQQQQQSVHCRSDKPMEGSTQRERSANQQYRSARCQYDEPSEQVNYQGCHDEQQQQYKQQQQQQCSRQQEQQELHQCPHQQQQCPHQQQQQCPHHQVQQHQQQYPQLQKQLQQHQKEQQQQCDHQHQQQPHQQQCAHQQLQYQHQETQQPQNQAQQQYPQLQKLQKYQEEQQQQCTQHSHQQQSHQQQCDHQQQQYQHPEPQQPQNSDHQQSCRHSDQQHPPTECKNSSSSSDQQKDCPSGQQPVRSAWNQPETTGNQQTNVLCDENPSPTTCNVFQPLPMVKPRPPKPCKKQQQGESLREKIARMCGSNCKKSSTSEGLISRLWKCKSSETSKTNVEAPRCGCSDSRSHSTNQLPMKSNHWTQKKQPDSRTQAYGIEVFIPYQSSIRQKVKQRPPPRKIDVQSLIQDPAKCQRPGTEAKPKSRVFNKEWQESSSSNPCIVQFDDKKSHCFKLPRGVKTGEEVRGEASFAALGSSSYQKPAGSFKMDDVNDAKPNMSTLKYRLAKCPVVKEMWQHADCQLPKISAKPVKIPPAIPVTRRKVAPFKASGEWGGQKYQIRLRIYKSKDCLDPCLPKMAEVTRDRSRIDSSMIQAPKFKQTDHDKCMTCPCSAPPTEPKKNVPTLMKESTAQGRKLKRAKTCLPCPKSRKV
ncbi:uncharacterized protein LOC143215016 [Lasioglossum baleicum]|uniref:uncharacterized protein LOC143215016 n=1 Tax=Lasioglossum baleicum TaxID=434251 RepID=UPI003FCE3EFC